MRRRTPSNDFSSGEIRKQGNTPLLFSCKWRLAINGKGVTPPVCLEIFPFGQPEESQVIGALGEYGDLSPEDMSYSRGDDEKMPHLLIKNPNIISALLANTTALEQYKNPSFAKITLTIDPNRIVSSHSDFSDNLPYEIIYLLKGHGIDETNAMYFMAPPANIQSTPTENLVDEAVKTALQILKERAPSAPEKGMLL